MNGVVGKPFGLSVLDRTIPRALLFRRRRALARTVPRDMIAQRIAERRLLDDVPIPKLSAASLGISRVPLQDLANPVS